MQGAEMRGSGTGVMVRIQGHAALPGARRTGVGGDSRLDPRRWGSGSPWLGAPRAGATSQPPRSFPVIVCAVTGRGSPRAS